MTRRARSRRGSEAQARRALELGEPQGVLPEGAISAPDDLGGNSGHATQYVQRETRAFHVRSALEKTAPTEFGAAGSMQSVPQEMSPARGSVPARADQVLGLDVAMDDSAAQPQDAQPQGMQAQDDAGAAEDVRVSDAPKARRVSTMAQQQGVKREWRDSAPMAELAELAKSYHRVAVKVCRHNSFGSPATIYARALFTPGEIATIESWLQMQAGGGSYLITVSDPADPLREICPGFIAKVEGASRTPLVIDELHADPDAPQYPPEYDAQRDRGAVQGGGGPSYAPQRPAFNGGGQGGGGYPGARGYERPAPGATMSSDAVLMRELEQARADRARLEADNKRLIAAAEERNRTLEKQLVEQREAAREERHRADMQRLSDQIAAMKSAPKDDSTGSSLRVLEIMAPLVATWLKDGSSSQARLMEAMLLKGRDSDPFADIARLEPLITKLSGQRGDKDASGLIAKMNEGQMQNVLLMAELVKSFAEEKLPEDSPGMKILQQAVGSIGAMGEAYFRQKAEEAEKEAQDKTLAAQRERTRAMEAEAASRRVREVASPQPAHASPRPSTVQPTPAAQAQGAVQGTLLPPELAAQMAMLPPTFQTPEWKKLLTELHLERDGKPLLAADEMGNYFAHYLEHLVMFGQLPQELAGVLTEPQKTIDFIFTLLPVARRHPAYAKAVGAVVVGVFSKHAASASAVAPAPAPTPAQTPQVVPVAEANGAGVEEDEEEDDDEERVYPQ